MCWRIDNAITASVDSYSPSQITLAKGLVAGSVNLLLGMVLYSAPTATVILVALAIGALGYGISITTWITGARLVGAASVQAFFALAPFVGALLAWPINGDRLTTSTAIAFTVSLVGVLVVATGRHAHSHIHEHVEHIHAIDLRDAHHRPGVIEVLAGTRHRHLALSHEHEHLPDVHHRHTH